MVYKWGTEATKDSALLVVAAFCVRSKPHPGKNLCIMKIAIR